MYKNLLPRLFTFYRKLLCDCFNIWNTWKHRWNETDDEIYLCFTWQFLWTLKFTLSSSQWESALSVISDNCLSLAFRKCKKDSNMILKVFLVQGLCPLKTEIADFLSAFVWRSQEEWEEQCQLHVVTVRLCVYLCIYFFRFFFCFLVTLVHLVLLYQ